MRRLQTFVCAGGGDLEIARPTFLLDLANMRTGWLRFQEGQAPERLIDPALDKVAPKPDETFKRGFVVMAFSPKFFGGAVELASASIHVSNAFPAMSMRSSRNRPDARKIAARCR